MNGNQVIEISLDKILPNRFQPRIKFHEKNINELAESIREHGVIQPIVVRKISDKYEIIAGERRYKASVLANKKSIPALIVNLNDKDAAEVALIENVQRQDLTPIEEAVSYKKILDMGITQEQLAQKLGKTQSTVANKLRLLNLDEEVQEALLEQKISERHARSLLKLNDLKDQVEILNRIISERLTVRKTDQVIKDYLANKTNEIVKNKIEVLDIEEKGDINMNYDYNNMNFNIPNTPIEGDNQQNNETPNQNGNSMMPDAPVLEPIPDFGLPVQENVTNPGFMDVNKIENQAQDIFTETPKADVDNLLNEDQKMVEINNQFAAQNNNDDESNNGGKFFNFMPNNNQENFVSDLEKQETNMNFMPQEETPQPQYNFDAFFNNNYVETNQPTQLETPIVNNISMGMPVENSINNNVNENPINVEPISNNISTENTFNSIPKFEPNFSQINSDTNTVMGNNNFGINNNVNNENSGFTFEEPVLEPIQPMNNVNMNDDTVNSEVSMPNFNSMPQFDMNLNNNFGINNSSVEPLNSVNPEPVMPNVEETPTTPQDLGFNMDFRNINPTEEVTNTPATPTIPEFNVEHPMFDMNYNQNVSAMSQEPVTPIITNNNMVNMEQSVTPTVQAPALDYNEAINTLKNCCNELQNKGFNISIEQFDLEDMAQLIVKIQK